MDIQTVGGHGWVQVLRVRGVGINLGGMFRCLTMATDWLRVPSGWKMFESTIFLQARVFGIR